MEHREYIGSDQIKHYLTCHKSDGPGACVKVDKTAVGNAVDDEVEDVCDHQAYHVEDSHLGGNNVPLSHLLHIQVLSGCVSSGLGLKKTVEVDVGINRHKGVGDYHSLINGSNLCIQ